MNCNANEKQDKTDDNGDAAGGETEEDSTIVDNIEWSPLLPLSSAEASFKLVIILSVIVSWKIASNKEKFCIYDRGHAISLF